MEQLGPRIEGVENSVNEIKETVERMATNHTGNQNVTSVNNSDGKTATWVVLVLAAAVLGWNIAQMGQIADLKTQVRRLEDYQTTTYILVPKLRELVDEQIARKQEKK